MVITKAFTLSTGYSVEGPKEEIRDTCLTVLSYSITESFLLKSYH